MPSKSSACVLVSACSLFAGATLSQQILVFSPDLGPAGTQTANFINDFRQSWSHHAEALVFPQLPWCPIFSHYPKVNKQLRGEECPAKFVRAPASAHKWMRAVSGKAYTFASLPIWRGFYSQKTQSASGSTNTCIDFLIKFNLLPNFLWQHWAHES